MADTVVAASLTLDPKQANQSVASFKAELKKAQQEVITLTDKFGATSKAATDAAKRAAELKDRIGDAKKLVDSFNPDEKFRGFTQVLTGVAGGFSAITGAMGLLGVQSEDVQKQLLKVQSALAITQGLNTIGDSVQSFKNLGASIVQTFGKEGAIGIAIVGAAALGVAIYELTKNTDNQTLSQKQLNEVNKEAAKNSVSQRTELNLLYDSAKNVNLSVADRLDNVKQLQEKFPGYFEDIKTEKDLNDKLTGAYDAATKGILAKAHATAVFNKIVENENKALELRTELEKEQTKLDASNDKIAKARDKEQRGLEQFEQSRLANSVQAIKDQIASLDVVNKALEKSTEQAGPTTDDAARRQKEKDEADRKADAANKEFLRTHTFFGGKWYTKEEFAQAIKDGLEANRLEIEKAVTGKVGEERPLSPEEIELEARLKANKDFFKAKSELRSNDIVEEQNHTFDLESETRKRIAQQNAEFENRKAIASAVSNLLNSAADLFGRQTAAGKALSIASATINTLVGVTETLRAKSVLPEPIGTIVKIASAATLLANGFATVKKIASVNVPGGGGGSVPSAPSLNVPAPLAPQAQVQTTRLDQQTLNNTNNAAIPVQAFVVESQGADARERIERLNRAARLGG